MAKRIRGGLLFLYCRIGGFCNYCRSGSCVYTKLTIAFYNLASTAYVMNIYRNKKPKGIQYCSEEEILRRIIIRSLKQAHQFIKIEQRTGSKFNGTSSQPELVWQVDCVELSSSELRQSFPVQHISVSFENSIGWKILVIRTFNWIFVLLIISLWDTTLWYIPVEQKTSPWFQRALAQVSTVWLPQGSHFLICGSKVFCLLIFIMLAAPLKVHSRIAVA